MAARRAVGRGLTSRWRDGRGAKHGDEPFGVEARILPSASRDALAIAIENAVEGCVRETYAALALQAT